MIFSELFQLRNNLKINFFYFTTFKWERKTSLTVFCKFTAESPLSEDQLQTLIAHLLLNILDQNF